MIRDKPFLEIQTWKSTPTRRVFILRQTPYELHVSSGGEMQWFNSASGIPASFAKVFESSPRKIQRQLAFHLDFFNP